MTRVFWTDCHRNFNEIQELNGMPLPEVGPRSTEAAAGWQPPNGAALPPPGLHTPSPEPTVEVRYH